MNYSVPNLLNQPQTPTNYSVSNDLSHIAPSTWSWQHALPQSPCAYKWLNSDSQKCGIQLFHVYPFGFVAPGTWYGSIGPFSKLLGLWSQKTTRQKKNPDFNNNESREAQTSMLYMSRIFLARKLQQNLDFQHIWRHEISTKQIEKRNGTVVRFDCSHEFFCRASLGGLESVVHETGSPYSGQEPESGRSIRLVQHPKSIFQNHHHSEPFWHFWAKRNGDAFFVAWTLLLELLDIWAPDCFDRLTGPHAACYCLDKSFAVWICATIYITFLLQTKKKSISFHFFWQSSRKFDMISFGTRFEFELKRNRCSYVTGSPIIRNVPVLRSEVCTRSPTSLEGRPSCRVASTGYFQVHSLGSSGLLLSSFQNYQPWSTYP